MTWASRRVRVTNHLLHTLSKLSSASCCANTRSYLPPNTLVSIAGVWEAFIQQCHIVGLYYLWIITTEGAFGGLSGTELSYRAKEQMYSSHIFIQSFREVPGHFLNVTSLIALHQSNELHSFTTLIFFLPVMIHQTRQLQRTMSTWSFPALFPWLGCWLWLSPVLRTRNQAR